MRSPLFRGASTKGACNNTSVQNGTPSFEWHILMEYCDKGECGTGALGRIAHGNCAAAALSSRHSNGVLEQGSGNCVAAALSSRHSNGVLEQRSVSRCTCPTAGQLPSRPPLRPTPSTHRHPVQGLVHVQVSVCASVRVSRARGRRVHRTPAILCSFAFAFPFVMEALCCVSS